jgi:hypothetical protein
MLSPDTADRYGVHLTPLQEAFVALRSRPRGCGDEYAGRVHAKTTSPPIAQGGRIGKNRPDCASPL